MTGGAHSGLLAGERTHSQKYGVIDARTACRMHALDERALAGLRVVGGGRRAHKRQPGGARLFLRKDVEACAARV
eukprot:SAG22_NODE_3643_length_1597_cov_4.369826_1_plen_74_part_10